MIESYKLSRTAENHIADIVEYTDDKHGPNQTDAYIAGLESSFDLLMRFPKMGVAAFEIKQGWRRYRYQKHYIFYSTQPGHIFVEAIIHVSRDIKPNLFE